MRHKKTTTTTTTTTTKEGRKEGRKGANESCALGPVWREGKDRCNDYYTAENTEVKRGPAGKVQCSANGR
jgi:hypothetical protein